jgi:hypothetical protein
MICGSGDAAIVDARPKGRTIIGQKYAGTVDDAIWRHPDG